MSISTNMEKLLKALEGAKHCPVYGVNGLGIAYLAYVASTKLPVVLVGRDSEQALELLRDARFLFGENHKNAVLFLPAQEQSAYHASSPDPLLAMERSATLHKIATGEPFKVLVTSLQALLTKTVPLEDFQKKAISLELGQKLDREALAQHLDESAYTRVNLVEDMGCYAVRGSIIDIYWPGAPYPIRIDLFGDEIDNLYFFDPQTQRLVRKVQEFAFGPAKEFYLDDEGISQANEKLQTLADALEYPTRALNEKLHDLGNKIPFFGVENLLPAFHKTLETPLTLLKRSIGTTSLRLILDDQETIRGNVASFYKDFDALYANALTRGELCFGVEEFVENSEDFLSNINDFLRLELSFLAKSENEALHFQIEATDIIREDILRESTRTDDESASEHAHHLLDPLEKLIRRLKSNHHTILLPVSSLGGAHRIKELLSAHGLQIQELKSANDYFDPTKTLEATPPSVHAYTFVAKPEPPSHGAIFHDLRLCVIPEEEIFGKRSRRRGDSGKAKGFRTTISDLEPEDHVVHVDHGLGIFKGLTKLNVRGVEQDYLLLQYAGDDKLYLPVHRIHLIQRYSGADGKSPRLDKLGGPGWQSKKKKVKEAVIAMAQDLLNLYAKRELVKRPIFSKPTEEYWEFEAQFPFEETPDQQKAIDEIIQDMQKEKPMDRLICGDVGYGKTEVAMRAAMMCVLSGRQVAVLAPTTVLAQQHAITFTERFKDTGAQIGVISRFQSNKDIKDTIQKTKDGQIDILIGTHRLLSKDVTFKHLGLLIVDEEQRFGIKAKEYLKKMRSQIDVLTMSATPIPRTLQMSFFGIRDLSIIETPPTDRRAIRTSIVRFEDASIREAMMRELNRGGQVYFVHNRVRSIDATAEYLKRLIPEAKIEVAHGQMAEDDLEDVMVRFMNHDFNVLVCTTIIETGIDVPSANTIFIDHADDFGLAQLYQLRGRVGRSKERAFAYLLIPATTESLTPIARKRLEVLHRFSELGAGFRIAQHDLELRGAGDLLGRTQHGHVAAVGYDLYADLLKEAVENLRGREHEEVPDPDVNLPVAALIPDKYVTELHERLGCYQQLATAESAEAIFDVIGSMNDRYGEEPEEVKNLAEVMILKQQLRKIAALSLDISKGINEIDPPKFSIALGDNAKLDGNKLISWIAKQDKRAMLTPKMKLLYQPTVAEWLQSEKDIFALAKKLIATLIQEAK